jgi:hypothetical protein
MTKFVSKVPGSAKLGQRARVTDPMCRLAVMDVRPLCRYRRFHGTERAAFMSCSRKPGMLTSPKIGADP